MKETVIAVGSVPDEVVNVLVHLGARVTRTKTGDSPDQVARGAELLVLHIEANHDDRISEWLDFALSSEMRVALTSSGVVTGRVARLLFHPAVYPLLPLNAGDNGVSEPAIRMFLHHIIEPDEITQDDVEIGSVFGRGATLRDYESQRFLSLASMSMHDFLSDLRDAIEAMGNVELPGRAPWDPFDLQPSALRRNGSSVTLQGTKPNLSDLFAAHDLDEAQSRLGSTPTARAAARSWNPPHLLIRGESGSGKSLVADLVHELLANRVTYPEMPLVTVNCAALDAGNLDHELFGAAPGSWTGISEPVVGLLARASYGVAFLDEIGDLGLSAQKRLLVFLGDGLIRPFGIQPFPAYSRVIAATNRDIPFLVSQQDFRNDLNERFQKQVIVPPLRDRDTSEISRLIDFVALNPTRNRGLEVSHIGPDALLSLHRHEYRNGNFRELETVVHDGIARARRRRSRVIRARDLSFAESRIVSDRQARVIPLAPDQEPPKPRLRVVDDSSLDKLATVANAPVLRSPDGCCYVITGGVTYYSSPEAGHSGAL